MNDSFGTSKSRLRIYPESATPVTQRHARPPLDDAKPATGTILDQKDALVSNHSHESTLSDRQQRELDRITGVGAPKSVEVSMSQIVPLLLDAAGSDRGWLQDFANDTVRIDADLYEVLLAYKQFRECDAA